MKETIVVSISKEASDSIETKGKRSSIQRYIDKGYYIKQNRNGYWVLVKPTQVNVTLQKGKKIGTFNMKEEICDHYGKRISDALIKKFREDINQGRIVLKLESKESYSFNPTK